jgi:hypothetical protein
MREVGHERHVLAGRANLTEKPKEVIRIGIGHEPVWPVGSGLGPKPDALDMGQVRVEERFDESSEDTRLHHHGVTPGKEYAGDLGMLFEIGDELTGLSTGELEFIVSDELGPPEAV